MIVLGRAGYNVWAVRDPDYYGIDEKWDENGNRREVLRVFCRGGIAGWMWFAMFSFSKMGVKGLGSVWKDAEDKIVIQME